MSLAAPTPLADMEIRAHQCLCGDQRCPLPGMEISDQGSPLLGMEISITYNLTLQFFLTEIPKIVDNDWQYYYGQKLKTQKAES